MSTSTTITQHDQYKATCDNQCGTVLGEDEHIHIFTKAAGPGWSEKVETWCDACFHDLRDQMKEEGWKHDEEHEDECECNVCVEQGLREAEEEEEEDQERERQHAKDYDTDGDETDEDEDERLCACSASPAQCFQCQCRDCGHCLHPDVKGCHHERFCTCTVAK
jgi:hypothetical protein